MWRDVPEVQPRGVVSRGSTFQLPGPRGLKATGIPTYLGGDERGCRLRRADEVMRRLSGWSASCLSAGIGCTLANNPSEGGGWISRKDNRASGLSIGVNLESIDDKGGVCWLRVKQCRGRGKLATKGRKRVNEA